MKRLFTITLVLLMLLGLLLNLGVLFYFKYHDFFAENMNAFFGTNWTLYHVALPLGISFFTFQAMSYVFDVAYGRGAVQKNPMDVALYVSLFPQLIAGPIVRYADVADQLVERTHSAEKFAHGILRFSVGVGKKVLMGIRPEDVHDEPRYLETMKDCTVRADVEVTELMGAEI